MEWKSPGLFQVRLDPGCSHVTEIRCALVSISGKLSPQVAPFLMGSVRTEFLFASSFNESSEGRRGVLPLTPAPIPKKVLLREGRKMKASWADTFVCYRFVVRIKR